jgi:hypothetical protein
MQWFKDRGGLILPGYLQPGVGEPQVFDSEVLRLEPEDEERIKQLCSELAQKYSSLDWLVWLRSPLGLKLSDYVNDGFESHLTAVEMTCDGSDRGEPVGPGGLLTINVAGSHGIELLAAMFVLRRRRVERLLEEFDVKIQPLPNSWKIFNERAEKSSMLSFRSIGPLLGPPNEQTSEAWLFPWTARWGPPTGFQLLPTDLSGLTRTPRPIACAQFVGDIMYLSRLIYLGLRAEAATRYREQFRGTGCLFFRADFLRNLHHPSLERSIAEALPNWSFGSSGSFVKRMAGVGVCRLANGLGAFDLFYGTCQLQESLERELVGTGENWRGKCFADCVQAYLDQSVWNPGEHRRLRGKKPIREDGEALTDLDAVGVKDGYLLVCECKGVSCGLLRRKPEKSQWNSAKSAVERYTQSWIAELRQNKLFTGFKGVLFTVVTPLPFPIDPKYLKRDQSGFPRTCSIDELAEIVGMRQRVAYFDQFPHSRRGA